MVGREPKPLSKEAFTWKGFRYTKTGTPIGKPKTFIDKVWDDDRIWNDQNRWEE